MSGYEAGVKGTGEEHGVEEFFEKDVGVRGSLLDFVSEGGEEGVGSGLGVLVFELCGREVEENG